MQNNWTNFFIEKEKIESNERVQKDKNSNITVIAIILFLIVLFICAALDSQEKKETGTFFKPLVEIFNNDTCKIRGHIDQRFLRLKDHLQINDKDCITNFCDLPDKTVMIRKNCKGRKFKCLRCGNWVKVYNKDFITIWQNDYYFPLKY